MTVPDPHTPPPPGAPVSRRAAREARARAAAAQDASDAPVTRRALREAAAASTPVATRPIPVVAEPHGSARTGSPADAAGPGDHPPIFRPPPREHVVVQRPAVLPGAASAALVAEAGGPARSGRPRPPRHVRSRRRHRLVLGVGIAAVVLVGGVAGAAAMLTSDDGNPPSTAALQVADGARARLAPPLPTGAPSASPEQLPPVAAPASVDPCDVPAFTAALAAHDDTAAIEAAGGADSFRAAVVARAAPCVSLADPTHVWVVVNKLRPYAPVDYAPSPMVLPADVRSLEGGTLRSDAAAALTRLADASRAAGAGDLALLSGYRSYATQHTSYQAQVSTRGVPGADEVSARPGYSEHQSGLAGDVVACTTAGCSSIDALATTPQGAWIAANCWRYGWIVRYEAGQTSTTGYLPEPWHLRYIGVPLATAYHDGGFHTLEQFFGLPAAPDYAQ